jgi:hypothetical protein
MLKRFVSSIKRSKKLSKSLVPPLFLLLPLSDPSLKLMINEKGEATDVIVRLLAMTQIKVAEKSSKSTAQTDREAKLVLKSRAVEEVTNAIQGKTKSEVSWRRNPTVERWEMVADLSDDCAKAIRKICQEDLRLEQRVLPQHKAYAGVLFLGTTLKGARSRLRFLNDLVDKTKLRFKKIYILTGDRDLDERVGETEADLLNANNSIIPVSSEWVKPAVAPCNERDMLVLVFEQSQNQNLRDKKQHVIYAEKRPNKRRAETGDTIEEWLKMNPKRGHYIAISNQPFVLYQQLVINRVLLRNRRTDISVEVIGDGMENEPLTSGTNEVSNEAAIHLDTLSKIFYEYVEIKKLLSGKI